jgi:hypothetical protein
VIEDDAVSGALHRLNYTALYITEPHITDAAAAAIAKWVHAGGVVYATAGAGLRNEFNDTNVAMAALLGVAETATRTSAHSSGELHWLKDDLPFSTPLERVSFKPAADSGAIVGATMPALGRVSVFTSASETPPEVLATFSGSGKPALLRRAVGRGQAFYSAFLPGLAYFFPAIPRRPADRGCTDESDNHFVPRDFDTRARALIGLGATAGRARRPVLASEPLVETGVITAVTPHHGTVLPLINWAGAQPGATLSSYAVVDCRWRPFLRELHSNLAAIAVIDGRSDCHDRRVISDCHPSAERAESK